MKILQLIGIDSWNRPVYEDDAGRLWKDVNLGSGVPRLFSANNNAFDGEPDIPLKDEFKIYQGEGQR